MAENSVEQVALKRQGVAIGNAKSHISDGFRCSAGSCLFNLRRAEVHTHDLAGLHGPCNTQRDRSGAAPAVQYRGTRSQIGHEELAVRLESPLRHEIAGV